MKQKIFGVYITLIALFTVMLFMGFGFLENAMYDTSSNALFIHDFEYNGVLTDFSERKIDPKDSGIFNYERRITEAELENISGDLMLLITRLRGNWHKIYWNGTLIAEIGSSELVSNNIWHDSYKFAIDRKLIDKVNTLSFTTYSEYKIGFSTVPIVIAGGSNANKLYAALKMVHSNFYSVVISSMVALSSMQLLLFGMTKAYDKRYSLLPLSILAVSIYLLDYVVFPYAPLSPLLFKKIIILALYMSTMIMGLALSRIYEKKILLWASGALLGAGLTLCVFSSNIVMLSDGYNVINLFLLVNVLLWFVTSLRSYIRKTNPEDVMIAIASLLLLVPGTYDTFILLLDYGEKLRMTVFGVTFYAAAVLLIAMINYIDYQKKIYLASEELATEKERMAVALNTDELTGLSNHRKFFEKFQNEILSDGHHTEILFIDIDQFRAVNNAFGHTVGDEILKRIAEIIVEHAESRDHVFRFGGEEFVMMCNILYYQNPKEVAEKIRQAVIKDKLLTDMCSFFTLTVSIGIAGYPMDSVAPKMVVRKAEKANEYAKASGRNRICVYERSIEDKLESAANQQLKKTLLSDFVFTLAAAIDMKDIYTGRHSEEVTRYAMMIADEMHLSDDMKYALKFGSMLHDLGKIAIPDMIIRKKDQLSEEEYEKIKEHTIIGYNLIKELVDDNLVVTCVRNHHERVDGKGYPDGQKGDEIPLLARIVCIADAYHAMISARPYRKELSQKMALEQLELFSNRQFDAQIVEVFVKVITGNNN